MVCAIELGSFFYLTLRSNEGESESDAQIWTRARIICSAPQLSALPIYHPFSLCPLAECTAHKPSLLIDAAIHPRIVGSNAGRVEEFSYYLDLPCHVGCLMGGRKAPSAKTPPSDHTCRKEAEILRQRLIQCNHHLSTTDKSSWIHLTSSLDDMRRQVVMPGSYTVSPYHATDEAFYFLTTLLPWPLTLSISTTAAALYNYLSWQWKVK